MVGKDFYTPEFVDMLSTYSSRESMQDGAFGFLAVRTAHWVSVDAGASLLRKEMIYKSDQCSLKDESYIILW